MARTLRSIIRGFDITTKNAWMNYLIVNPFHKGIIYSNPDKQPDFCDFNRLMYNDFFKEYLVNGFKSDGVTFEELNEQLGDLFLNCKTYKKDVDYSNRKVIARASLIGDKILFEMLYDKRILSSDRYLEAVGKLALSKRTEHPLKEVMFMNWATNSTYRFKFDREFWKRATEYKKFLA